MVVLERPPETKLLMCEACLKPTPHRFSHKLTSTGDLYFQCACGHARIWGSER